MNFIKYDSTGRIRSFGTTTQNIQDQDFGDGDIVAEGSIADLAAQYVPDVLTPVVTDKPTNTTTLNKTTVVADGVDKILVDGIPIGAEVTLGEVTIIADEATADLIFDISGAYIFKVVLFPYLDYMVTINAT